MLGFYARKQRGDRCIIAVIAGHRHTTTAACLPAFVAFSRSRTDRAGEVIIAFIHRASGDVNAGALFREHQRNTLADAPARARYQRDLTCQRCHSDPPISRSIDGPAMAHLSSRHSDSAGEPQRTRLRQSSPAPGRKDN